MEKVHVKTAQKAPSKSSERLFTAKINVPSSSESTGYPPNLHQKVQRSQTNGILQLCRLCQGQEKPLPTWEMKKKQK
jgi:hypothetical protein